MDETWSWESEPGSGTSRIVELLPPPEPPDGIRAVGHVAGGRAEVRDDDWESVSATIRLDPLRFTADALRGLDAFSHVEVLYRFDRATPRACTRARAGPAATRRGPRWASSLSAARTAPTGWARRSAGSSPCAALELDVAGLDAVDGTPGPGLKPCMRGFLPRGTITEPAWAAELMRGYW